MSQINGGRIVPILTGHDLSSDLFTSFDRPALLSSSTEHSSISSSSSSSPSSTRSCTPAPTMAKPKKEKRPKGTTNLDMASLKERALFALPTEGDGNCLYYSLSDQLFGDFDHGDEIRQKVADHISANKDYFMQFVSEGGERRRPRRAAASTYATRSADVSAPTQEDKERRFHDMIAKTRKNFEWASSEHVQAFCQAYRLDVMVYTSDGVHEFQDVNASPTEARNVVHVAFHDFKHYSSVRSIEGKHEGLFVKLEQTVAAQPSDIDAKPDVKSDVKSEVKPEVVPPEIKPDHASDDGHKESLVAEEKVVDPRRASDANLAVDVYAPWDISTIQEGLGGRYDRETIVDMLQKCRGDIDRAFAALLDDKADSTVDKKSAPVIPVKPSLQASRDSSPFSTGSKRSADDSGDDSEDPRPARRVRAKKRMISNLTLGVGISFRDADDELVSLNLHVNPDSEQGQDTDPSPAGNTSPEHSDAEGKCRRSGRLSRSRLN